MRWRVLWAVVIEVAVLTTALLFVYLRLYLRPEIWKDLLEWQVLMLVLLGFSLTTLFVMLVIAGARRSWTGFQGKTLWDWLQLLSALAIPIVLAVAGFLFTSNQNARQQALENQRTEAAQKLEDQRAQSEALQAYLDQMSQLLLDRNLLKSKEDDSVRVLAQARTTTIISSLETQGNRSVTRFLTDSGLTGAPPANLKQASSVSLLSQAELPDAHLAGAFLPSADLTQAKLQNADLSHAFLVSADLSYTNLKAADLKNANLLFVDFSGANLRGADLRGVDLTEANLEGANLDNANLTGVELTDLLQPGISLDGANLVDADLAGRNLTDASLKAADLLEANLANANLRGANLSEANLANANLQGADLSSVNLSKVNFEGANLAQADLTEADVTTKQLKQAKSLKGATMPNGQKYEDWIKSRGKENSGP